MRVGKWIVVSLGLLISLGASGCKPKVGGRCTPGQVTCTKDGALFCGDDNKFVAEGCHGPLGCIQHGRTASCDVSAAVALDGCEDNDNIACSVGKDAVLDCKNHKWTVGATCKGVKGCTTVIDELFCDHTIAEPADPCHRDGQIACSTDKNFILKCQDKVFVAIDSCRGPKSCTFIEEPARQLIDFNCDDSLAQENDPCASENNHACSTDKKAMFVCRNNKFVPHKTCAGPGGCSVDASGDKLNCDTGSGIFSGAGGAAKVSAAAGGAGSKGKAAAGAAGAAGSAAKSVTSAAVAASAKPAASASAAVAASASAKPGASAAASASAKPGASAKPAASAKIKK